MTCGGNYDLRLATLQNMRDQLICLYEQGLLIDAWHNVQIVKEDLIGRNDLAGEPGRPVTRKRAIVPPPTVDMKSQFKQDDHIIQKFGDAKLNRIVSLDYTREDLEGADYFLIDDSPYTLVEGSLSIDKVGFFWSMVLRRKKQNDSTAP